MITELFKKEIIKSIELMNNSNLLFIEIDNTPGFFVYSPYYAEEKKGDEFLHLEHQEKKYIVTML